MRSKLKVLLVEDREFDAALVLRELRKIALIESRRVDTRHAMTAALADCEWDIVISDWTMPEFSALGALATLAAAGLDIPFIIVSGTVGEEAAVEAMRAGARDFVLKGKLTRLCPAVERELKEGRSRASRRRAEHALGLSEARFRRLSESGIVGIALAEVGGEVHYANKAYLDLLGCTREERASGQIRWDLSTPPEWARSDAEAVASLRLTGVARPWEKEFLRKDGVRVPVLIGVAMLEGSNCIAFVADLTARKQAEAALRRAEEQLRQSQKLEAIGLLAGGVAHDFNNLLSVILSFSEMVMDDLEVGDPMRDDLQQIKLAGERAARLTRQLLAFSRQQAINPDVLDLNEIIKSMDKMLRRLIREDVEFIISSLAGLEPCKADRGQIEQVVMNLVVNAGDAMPDGGKLIIETANAEVDARAHSALEAGRYVMLAVSDTGTGMNEATQERIFEPFFTTKERGKGTGLGLSTVFGIAEQSGGTVLVQSEVGKGTTIRVYLPCTDEEPVAARPRPAVTSLEGTETILLVEDEDQIRTSAREILQRQGYRVIECRNAGEALIACEQHTGAIELLLSDVVMPRMSGEQLANRLAPLQPEMKVLFMSGYGDGSLSGWGVLAKPLTPGALARRIREVLDSPR